MQNMQTQQVINDFLHQVQTQVPPPCAFSDNKPKPLFPQDPIMQQHLRAVGMSQQSRKPNTAASSNNDLESIHEPKGTVGRPRNSHGVPTETRTDPFYLQSQPTGFIRTQLSNRGWRSPHFQHLTQKRYNCKAINKRTLFEITISLNR